MKIITRIISFTKSHLLLTSFIALGSIALVAVLITSIIYTRRSHSNNTNNESSSENKSSQNTSTNAQDKSLQANNENPNNPSSSPNPSSAATTNTSSTTGASQSNPSSVTAAPKVTNWGVYIYQKNITTCGTISNPCPLPAGLVLSIIAKDNITGTILPLADCSITAGPDGTFSIPGGSFSANPTVYSDAGVPVCGGGLDFPVAGHYIINYEVWPANSVNMDLRYRGGKLMDFYVKN